MSRFIRKIQTIIVGAMCALLICGLVPIAAFAHEDELASRGGKIAANTVVDTAIDAGRMASAGGLSISGVLGSIATNAVVETVTGGALAPGSGRAAKNAATGAAEAVGRNTAKTAEKTAAQNAEKNAAKTAEKTAARTAERSETVIIGQGHGPNPAYQSAINTKIEEIAGTGEFAYVYGNRALNTAGLEGSQRPDIIALRPDGSAVAYEYASPSQAVGKPGYGQLLDKIYDMKSNNPDLQVELIEWGSYGGK